MNNIKRIILFLLGMSMTIVSCQKAPYLTLDEQKSLTFKDNGGSQTVSFTCNRAWTATSSDSWLMISPSKGDANEEGAQIIITCDANTTYDPRTAMVSITSEGLVETISVSQDTNYGLFFNPTTFDLSNAAQDIEVEVKANVDYDILVPEEAKGMITSVQTVTGETKALVGKKVRFGISENPEYERREATVTFMQRNGELYGTCTISQAQQDLPIGTFAATLKEAGTLSSLLTSEECAQIKNLTLKGKIDARDFNFIKWNMLNVENIDISNVEIEAYLGDCGTNEGYEAEYPANTIPLGAFFYWESHFENGVDVDNDPEFYDEGMSSIKTIKLPSNLVGIERNAFARAYNLVEINIPEGVTHIDYVSFRYCVSLKAITIPSTVTTIGLWAFTQMNALEKVYCYATTPPSTNQSFGGVDDIAGARGWVRNDTYNSEITATLYVPGESVGLYQSSEWSDYFSKIEAIH